MPSSTLRTTRHHLIKNYHDNDGDDDGDNDDNKDNKGLKVYLQAILEYPVLIPSAIKLPIWGEQIIEIFEEKQEIYMITDGSFVDATISINHETGW